MSVAVCVTDVYVISDYLSPVNARPLDVYYGYPDGNQGVRSVGRLAPATQTIHTQAQYRAGHAGGAMAAAPSTMPPWNPGPAETVDLPHTTEAGVGGKGVDDNSIVIGKAHSSKQGVL